MSHNICLTNFNAEQDEHDEDEVIDKSSDA